MKDQFDRNIDYMRISITDRCNLRCAYCMPRDIRKKEHEEILTYEEILRICRAAVTLGIAKFKITGGEPLVRRGCVPFMQSLKELPGSAQVTLTTNGILLAGYLDTLADCGIDGINISIDSLDAKKYKELTGCAGAEVAKVLAALERGASLGLRMKVNAVLLDQTEEDLTALASIAARHPIDVRFIELMPIGEGRARKGMPIGQALKILRCSWPDLAPTSETRGNGPARYYRSRGLLGRIGCIDALSHAFCGGCNRVRLTSTGYLKPCLSYEEGTDLRALLRGGATDDELCLTLQNGIYCKPRAHSFLDKSGATEHRNMNQIGG